MRPEPRWPIRTGDLLDDGAGTSIMAAEFEVDDLESDARQNLAFIRRR